MFFKVIDQIHRVINCRKPCFNSSCHVIMHVSARTSVGSTHTHTKYKEVLNHKAHSYYSTSKAVWTDRLLWDAVPEEDGSHVNGKLKLMEHRYHHFAYLNVNSCKHYQPIILDRKSCFFGHIISCQRRIGPRCLGSQWRAANIRSRRASTKHISSLSQIYKESQNRARPTNAWYDNQTSPWMVWVQIQCDISKCHNCLRLPLFLLRLVITSTPEVDNPSHEIRQRLNRASRERSSFAFKTK